MTVPFFENASYIFWQLETFPFKFGPTVSLSMYISGAWSRAPSSATAMTTLPQTTVLCNAGPGNIAKWRKSA